MMHAMATQIARIFRGHAIKQRVRLWRYLAFCASEVQRSWRAHRGRVGERGFVES